MEDYASKVAAVTRCASRPVAVCGWSMGGLVALIAASFVPPDALVVIEPSLPSKLQGTDLDVIPVPGTYTAEEAYGPLSPGARHRSESGLARDERRRGISVPHPPCPMLVVHGRDFAETRGRPVVEYYETDELAFPDLNHTQLVTDPKVRFRVAEWLTRNWDGDPAA